MLISRTLILNEKFRRKPNFLAAAVVAGVEELKMEEVEKAEEKLGAPFGISWRARIPSTTSALFARSFPDFSQLSLHSNGNQREIYGFDQSYYFTIHAQGQKLCAGMAMPPLARRQHLYQQFCREPVARHTTRLEVETSKWSNENYCEER